MTLEGRLRGRNQPGGEERGSRPEGPERHQLAREQGGPACVAESREGEGPAGRCQHRPGQVLPRLPSFPSGPLCVQPVPSVSPPSRTRRHSSAQVQKDLGHWSGQQTKLWGSASLCISCSLCQERSSQLYLTDSRLSPQGLNKCHLPPGSPGTIPIQTLSDLSRHPPSAFSWVLCPFSAWVAGRGWLPSGRKRPAKP